MPGFFVGDVGNHPRGSASPVTEYYYTYTWLIENLFIDSNTPTTSDEKSVLVNAKEMTLPAFIVGKEMYTGASLEYKFAKSVSYDDVKVTWYDSVGLINIIKKWRESVWTPNTGLVPAGGYKKDSYLTQYIPNVSDQNDDVRRFVEYKLIGSWPSVIRHGDLTYANSDVKIVEVTITYDWAEEN